MINQTITLRLFIIAVLFIYTGNAAISQNNRALRHFDLGVEYFDFEQYIDAIDAFSKAIKIDDNFSEAHYNLGRVYKYSGKLQSAYQIYRDLKNIDSATAEKLLGILEMN